MVWLTLTIGVVNLCLGFGLAMYLGYGPPSLSEAWEVLCLAAPRAVRCRPPPSQPAAGLEEPLTPAPIETLPNDELADEIDWNIATIEGEARFYLDPLTGLKNPIGLEATLNDWWREGRHRLHPICLAMFDLDEFAEVNQQHGSPAGDRILCQVAQIVSSSLGTADVVGRFAGQRFLVALVDAAAPAATEHVERLRQSIAQTTFRHAGQEIKITTCGAITPVAPDDTLEMPLERLEAALGQAKQAGRNRCSFHNGQQAELVEQKEEGGRRNEEGGRRNEEGGSSPPRSSPSGAPVCPTLVPRATLADCSTS